MDNKIFTQKNSSNKFELNLSNYIRYYVSFTDDDPKNGNRSVQNLFNVAEKISMVYFNKDATSGEEARDLICICWKIEINCRDLGKKAPIMFIYIIG